MTIRRNNDNESATTKGTKNNNVYPQIWQITQIRSNNDNISHG